MRGSAHESARRAAEEGRAEAAPREEVRAPFGPGRVPYRRGFGGGNMAAAAGPLTEKVSTETGLYL